MSSLARRRARRRTGRHQAAAKAPDALAMALEMANLIGPSAARVGCVVGIEGLGTPGALIEIGAYDRATGTPKCWGCGVELDGRVVGTTRMGPVTGAPRVTITACDACWAPETRAVSS